MRTPPVAGVPGTSVRVKAAPSDARPFVHSCPIPASNRAPAEWPESVHSRVGRRTGSDGLGSSCHVVEVRLEPSRDGLWDCDRALRLDRLVPRSWFVHQKCPRCKPINPAYAQRRDCGYDFPTKTVKQSYLAAKDSPALQPASPVKIVVCVLVPLVGLALGLLARSRGRALAGRTMMLVSGAIIAFNVTIFLLWFWLER
jgi:phage FluMu protein Com